MSCAAPLNCFSPSCEAASLHAVKRDNVKAGPDKEGPPTKEEEEVEEEKMQANPAYLPIERSFWSQLRTAIPFEVCLVEAGPTRHRRTHRVAGKPCLCAH